MQTCARISAAQEPEGPPPTTATRILRSALKGTAIIGVRLTLPRTEPDSERAAPTVKPVLLAKKINPDAQATSKKQYAGLKCVMNQGETGDDVFSAQQMLKCQKLGIYRNSCG